MAFRDFLSSIGFGSMKVDTVVERPHLEEGETLNGTVYFEGGDSDQKVEFVEMQVIKQLEEHRHDSDFHVLETIVSKQTMEFAGAVKSKETIMQQFDIVPDERWMVENPKTKLLLRTIVHIENGVDARDEDEITYGKTES